MDLDVVLLTLGGVFLAGVVADSLGRHSMVPRVTLLLLIGLAIGPYGLALLPEGVREWEELLSAAALTMVAFLLGNALTPERLRAHGAQIVVVSLFVVFGSLAVVAAGLVALGAPVAVALMLAGIATATAPAATYDVIRQTGARGPFADLLMGIVAIDDAWGLIGFSLLLIAARSLSGDGATAAILSEGLFEMGGAILIGLAVGVPAAFLTGRLRPGEPMQAEALGVVFLCAGLAVRAGVSFLLAGMIAGTIIANLARHHERAFHEIERIEWPFMLVFFVVAGATFHLGQAEGLLLWTFGFFALRTAARILFGWLGGHAAGLPAAERRWIGSALMPQAGVAIGMALVAGDQFPEHAETILSVTLATTIAFELVGPVATLIALRRTGAIPPDGTPRE